MNTTSRVESKKRDIFCKHALDEVSQEIYRTNSIGEPVWGCIGKCYIDCEYNLNPKTETYRHNMYGRTSVW